MPNTLARVAKLADAIGLGPIARKGMGVRVSPWAQKTRRVRRDGPLKAMGAEEL